MRGAIVTQPQLPDRISSLLCFRKLLFVGMLTVVQQGSVLQICAGLATSFVFFAAHIRALPFRHVEDNVLKATTEAHLFIILVLVLTLRSGLENEVLDESFYDGACTFLFVIWPWSPASRISGTPSCSTVSMGPLTARTPRYCRQLSTGIGSGVTRQKIAWYWRSTSRGCRMKSSLITTCSSRTGESLSPDLMVHFAT
jgi:hypothetical protein